MLRHEPVLLAFVGNRQRGDGNQRLLPSLLPRDGEREPHLDVDGPQGRLHVADRRLDLDDEHDPRGEMVGEDVVPPAISVMVEADLDGNEPAGIAKHPRHRVLELGVPGINEAVELFAIPREPDLEAGAERACHALDLIEADAIPLPGLDTLNDLTRDSGQPGQVLLAEPQPSPQDPEAFADRSPHAPMMTRIAYRLITVGLSPGLFVRHIVDICPRHGRYVGEGDPKVDTCPPGRGDVHVAGSFGMPGTPHAYTMPAERAFVMGQAESRGKRWNRATDEAALSRDW